MSPLALDLLIRARVINIKRDALESAKALGGPKRSKSGPERPTKAERPRPVMILPSNSNFARRLLTGIVHRPR